MSITERGNDRAKSLSQRALCHDLVQYVSAATLVTAFPDDADLDPEVRHRFELIQKQLAQMHSLLRDCLDPSDHDAAADVIAVVRECVEAVAVRRPIELDVALPHAELLGNHQVLRRAVNNMLDNAIKASKAGGRVAVRVAESEDQVVIEVSDTGPGFGRIDSGHGLGMVSIADAMASFNGSLEISSSPEPGTSVRLLLPWRRS